MSDHFSCECEVNDLTDKLDSLRAENEKLKKDVENAVWNLAGCSTFAMGYGLDEPFDEKSARAAMFDVLRLAKKKRSLGTLCDELVEAATLALASHLGQLPAQFNYNQIGDLLTKALKKYHAFKGGKGREEK